MSDSRFRTRIEVRYAETDAMGIVHHASWPVWFELARVQFLSYCGLAYQDMEAMGFRMPVLRLEVDYLKSARFGDFVDVALDIRKEGAVRFVFTYKVTRAEVLLATGTSTHAITDQTGKAIRPPKQILKLFFPEETR